jgi:hypothetical protein
MNIQYGSLYVFDPEGDEIVSGEHLCEEIRVPQEGESIRHGDQTGNDYDLGKSYRVTEVVTEMRRMAKGEGLTDHYVQFVYVHTEYANGGD